MPPPRFPQPSVLVASLLVLTGTIFAADRPNILWINMDDVGTQLPCYGETAIKTPNIDRLVRDGTMFTRAFVTAPVCSPSRSAMITGMYQTSIGAQHHRSSRGPGVEKIALPTGVETVAALFQRAGYYTCNGDDPPKGKGLGKTDYNFDWDEKVYDGSDWSGRKPGQPFFAQIQLWGGKNRGRPDLYKKAIDLLGSATAPDSVTLPPYYPRDPVLLEDWAHYLDCIRYCDRQLGQILKRLEDEGILDQTIIFFMGDHGISHARGKQFLYDEGIRIPFIVSGPGIPRGKVRTDLIEHIDMAPTSLALADLPVPKWMQGHDLFAPDDVKRDAVFAARDRCDETVDRIRSVRTEQFKYIRNFFPRRPLLQPNAYKDHKEILQRLRELHAQGKLDEMQEKLLFSPTRPAEELYDVQADPFETVNLATDPKYQATLETLRARLDRWMQETNDHGLESEKACDANMAAQLKKMKPGSPRRRELEKNIALMKQWAAEGK